MSTAEYILDVTLWVIAWAMLGLLVKQWLQGRG